MPKEVLAIASSIRPQITRGEFPPLGTVEHLLQVQKASNQFRDSKLDKLYAFMSEYRIAESIAHFITQYDIPVRGQSAYHRSIDTRRLPGYSGGPVVHAEYCYKPVEENRYVFLSGRRWHDDPRSYNLKMYLTDYLDIDEDKPPEAHALGGPYPNTAFRVLKYTDPNKFTEYDERNPIKFLKILGAATLGLRQYVEARDNS